MAHENVPRPEKRSIVSVPGVVSVGERHIDGETVVVITVEHGSGLGPENLPSAVAGFPVVIEFGDPITFDRGVESSYTGRERPVVAGGSTSNAGISSVGTLGFVHDDAGSLLLTSNWHVWDGGEGSVGDVILQPGHGDGSSTLSDQIAELGGSFDPQIGDIDIAWALPIPGVDVSPGEVFGIGDIVGSRSPFVGEAAAKSGRTTGVTFGTVDQVGVSVEVTGPGYVLDGQVIIEMFADAGDSGSPVMNPDTGEAIALLWGSNGSIAACMDIEDVEDALGAPVAIAPAEGNIVVTDISVDAEPVEGRPVNVIVTADNTGGQRTSEQFTVFVDGTSVGSVEFDLAAGEIGNDSLSWTPAAAGTVTIEVGDLSQTGTVQPAPDGGDGGGDGVLAGIDPTVAAVGGAVVVLLLLSQD